ncbi:MAG: DUF4124 domain-containing protein [Gammaproteobacteria bacterium]|nr:DUF4124 domain-containing protein [Gammaproteobacteria bacterium]
MTDSVKKAAFHPFHTLLTVCFLTATPPIFAEVFKCEDAGGDIFYTSTPASHDQCQPLKISHTPATATTTSNGVKPAEKKPVNNQEGEPQTLDAIGELYQRNCQSAKFNKKIYESAAPLTAANGQTYTPSEEERSNKIAEADRQIKTYCSAP